ncbi:MAG TPA: sugar phosphate isomerase/epimerase [Terracidiphilus sp.]|nr:sugar phosphate isomerase/epimerase [Terracidiphilus sp.]
MQHATRREFLKLASAGAAAASLNLSAFGSALGLPVGLQLYSVRDLLPHDFAGTLKQISAIGYKEVESAGYYNHSSKEVKDALDAAGLRMPSAHYSYSDLAKNLDSILEFNRPLGVRTIICSYPGFKNPHQAKTSPRDFTMTDWHWNAERFNAFGEKARAAGMAFGYHNHTMEFRKENGIAPLDVLIRETDPKLVTFEMDCGWVVVGGGNPVDFLHRYPKRISMLHVKDFKKAPGDNSIVHPPPAAELGTGIIDYHPIFAAAKAAGIRHLFVEQEEFNLPPMQSLRIDFNYVNSFPA